MKPFHWVSILFAALCVFPVGSPAQGCAGDCDRSGTVTVDELIRGVNIALGAVSVDACVALDSGGNGQVEIDELVVAVNNALNGCPAEPTPTTTNRATLTPTAAVAATPSITATAAIAATPTPTRTAVALRTATPTSTPTAEPTLRPSTTVTATRGATTTATSTIHPSITSTRTLAPTGTATAPSTATATATRTGTKTRTPRPTGSPQCTTYDITVNDDGTFSYNGGPPDIVIHTCDTVRWVGLRRADSIVRVEAITPESSPASICFDASLAAPSYVYPHASAVDPNSPLDFSGPIRRGFSGIWSLGGEGDNTSNLELPSREAEDLYCTLHTCPTNRNDLDWNAIACTDFTHQVNADVPDPDVPGGTERVKLGYVYYQHRAFDSDADAERYIEGVAAGVDGRTHRLCNAATYVCDSPPCTVAQFVPQQFISWLPSTIPPGTYFNGLLQSTYENPDVAGVVLRFNWSDLQYDDNGTIRFHWQHLDRELERAIRHGKYVTLDVRAGMFGTPPWIFADYLDFAAQNRARWCKAPGCEFASAPPEAGTVAPLEFTDHYDEDPSGNGCGETFRIGAPGDPNYVALYTQFLAALARHLASDARWFETVAHVKVSGANLRTSEAELPHHCDDQYLTTANYHDDPKADVYRGADRVLDVYKSTSVEGNTTTRTIRPCACNPKIWWNNGYAPQQLYDYYARVESQILNAFFGRKSLGYQIIQDGFPRADAAKSFLGDHMYREVIEPSVPGNVPVNSCFNAMAACTTPGSFVEDRVTFASLQYCSIDQVIRNGTPFYCSLALLPLSPAAGSTFVSAYDTRSPDGAQRRYPSAFEQTETVLAEARQGRFVNPLQPSPNSPRAEGKLFIPQHSGIQPLPQEKQALGYSNGYVGECAQQRPRVAPPSPLPAGVGNLGNSIAGFPIPNGTAVSTLSQVPGCPNRWAADEGIQRTAPGVPPQLTGFQTSNNVRNLDEAESALFNLVYNTNAVFIEFYEDVIWRAAIVKGTGPAALPLSDTPRVPGSSCEHAPGDVELCYSKNLSQWNEELHYRRVLAGAAVNTATYPAFGNPFPVDYSVQLTNPGNADEELYFINPSKCDSSRIDMSGTKSANALGRIVLAP